MDNKPFAKTSDKETAEYLKEAGFPFVQMEGDKYVFLNSGGANKFSSDEIDDKKVSLTSTLCV